MSNSYAWRDRSSLIGFVEERGEAWRQRASDQWETPNYFTGSIPEKAILERLYGWEAVSTPLFVRSLDGEMRQLVGKQVIMRGDAVLGIFTDTHRPLSYANWANDDVFSFTNEVGIGSASLLHDGSLTEIQLELPGNARTEDGIEFRPSVIAATSFDGSFSNSWIRLVTLVSQDVMMSATLVRADRSPSRFKLESKLEVHELLENTRHVFEAESSRWIRTPVSEVEWQLYLRENTKPTSGSKMAKTLADTKREQLQQLWSSDPSVSAYTGTGFGVLFAQSVYNHHYAIVRGMCRSERNMLNAVQGRMFVTDQATVESLSSILKLV